MANKRASSSQKRAQQNRAQRAALQARTKAAATPKPERRPAPSASAASGSAAPARKGGLFSGGSDRPPRPGDLPVDVETLEGSWISKRMQVPGGRQVLTGALLTVVLTVMLLFWKFPPADNPKGKATETIFDLFGGAAVFILIVPLVIVGTAARLSLAPFRRRVWLIGAVALFVVSILLAMPIYLFPAGFLGYAVMRAGRVEGPVPGTRAARMAETRVASAAASDDPDEA